jgi:hypothetical protein
MRVDKDLKGMTPAQLRREVMRLRTAFRKEAAHTGNHRCWINLLTVLPEGESIKPLTLAEDKFLGNCKKYWRRNS